MVFVWDACTSIGCACKLGMYETYEIANLDCTGVSVNIYMIWRFAEEWETGRFCRICNQIGWIQAIRQMLLGNSGALSWIQGISNTPLSYLL